MVVINYFSYEVLRSKFEVNITCRCQDLVIFSNLQIGLKIQTSQVAKLEF